ncbi:hypothetical protein Y032_0723g1839 [Ancylostoma ceylanicum]|uniref:Uncharacterized protein n=1 Tax=Ancylostoma ceylanicum TaxID=53326 RepID=A0A016WES3_9BILA|nr:hypothetical protein Y032_0723g1839 [Ancylostoma ceylanicum]
MTRYQQISRHTAGLLKHMMEELKERSELQNAELELENLNPTILKDKEIWLRKLFYVQESGTFLMLYTAPR